MVPSSSETNSPRRLAADQKKMAVLIVLFRTEDDSNMIPQNITVSLARGLETSPTQQ